MYEDEFNGQGGSYILDPKTGKRTRIEEPTMECAASAAPIVECTAFIQQQQPEAALLRGNTPAVSAAPIVVDSETLAPPPAPAKTKAAPVSTTGV